jgi:hypothetical protein
MEQKFVVSLLDCFHKKYMPKVTYSLGFIYVIPPYIKTKTERRNPLGGWLTLNRRCSQQKGVRLYRSLVVSPRFYIKARAKAYYMVSLQKLKSCNWISR